jgi:hypothetical protein
MKRPKMKNKLSNQTTLHVGFLRLRVKPPLGRTHQPHAAPSDSVLMDCRSWDEYGVAYVHPRPAPLTIRSRLMALIEMAGMGLILLVVIYGCASCDEAHADQPQDVMAAMFLPMLAAVEWSHAVNGNPCFPYGADRQGRPIHPLSHRRDGTLIVGTLNAFGESK